MIEFKNDKAQLFISMINQNGLSISVIENEILPRSIILNKKQFNDLINYLISRRREMR